MAVFKKMSDKFDEMYTEANRVKSFQNWPFSSDAKCAASKMAEAGFFHCPSEKEPDLVQCYVCFKELDGWNQDDDPWEEHLSHARNCCFAKLQKPQNNLTFNEVFEIEKQRKLSKLEKKYHERKINFEHKIECLQNYIIDLVENGEAPN